MLARLVHSLRIVIPTLFIGIGLGMLFCTMAPTFYLLQPIALFLIVGGMALAGLFASQSRNE